MNGSQSYDLMYWMVDIFSFCHSDIMITADTEMCFPLLYPLAEAWGRSGGVQ
jgi:hypothetical protein